MISLDKKERGELLKLWLRDRVSLNAYKPILFQLNDLIETESCVLEFELFRVYNENNHMHDKFSDLENIQIVFYELYEKNGVKTSFSIKKDSSKYILINECKLKSAFDSSGMLLKRIQMHPIGVDMSLLNSIFNKKGFGVKLERGEFFIFNQSHS